MLTALYLYATPLATHNPTPATQNTVPAAGTLRPQHRIRRLPSRPRLPREYQRLPYRMKCLLRIVKRLPSEALNIQRSALRRESDAVYDTRYMVAFVLCTCAMSGGFKINAVVAPRPGGSKINAVVASRQGGRLAADWAE